MYRSVNRVRLGGRAEAKVKLVSCRPAIPALVGSLGLWSGGVVTAVVGGSQWEAVASGWLTGHRGRIAPHHGGTASGDLTRELISCAPAPCANPAQIRTLCFHDSRRVANLLPTSNCDFNSPQPRFHDGFILKFATGYVRSAPELLHLPAKRVRCLQSVHPPSLPSVTSCVSSEELIMDLAPPSKPPRQVATKRDASKVV